MTIRERRKEWVDAVFATFGEGAAWRNLALFSTPGGWWAFDDVWWKWAATATMAGCALVAQMRDTIHKRRLHRGHHEP